MGKKCKKVTCPKCMPGWLAAFGDLMSLLLCFFVLLLSMSTMDAKKVSEAMGSLAGALSVLEGGTKTEVSHERNQQATPIQSEDETAQKLKTLKATLVELNEMTKSADNSETQLEEAENGFIIRLPANLLFKRDSARIENDDAILFLKRIALIIDKLPKTIRVNVIGHTDDKYRKLGDKFPSNWALSNARATSVVQELINNKIEPNILTSCGKAEFDPIASNLTPEGKEKNRRVELYFFSLEKDQDSKAQKSILDTKE
ncbi:MAG TPA: flagellar motor protein MotB [Campylobacterales bacterium]|nr:flagellar motor protein MotB [Campylobacterales bacterium]